MIRICLLICSVVLLGAAQARDLNINDWDDVITLRRQSGEVYKKDCTADSCRITTTSEPDQYGTIRGTLEITALQGGRWECSIDKGTPNIQSCAPFEREGHWRVEKKTGSGVFVLLKEGSFDNIARFMGWK